MKFKARTNMANKEVKSPKPRRPRKIRKVVFELDDIVTCNLLGKKFIGTVKNIYSHGDFVTILVNFSKGSCVWINQHNLTKKTNGESNS